MNKLYCIIFRQKVAESPLQSNISLDNNKCNHNRSLIANLWIRIS